MEEAHPHEEYDGDLLVSVCTGLGRACIDGNGHQQYVKEDDCIGRLHCGGRAAHFLHQLADSAETQTA